MIENRDYQRVARAIEYLTRHAGEQPSLAQVAASVDLSEFHFQRLFRRWAGVSPKRFLQFLAAERGRDLLLSSRTVLDASLAAGLSGGGRLHDLMVAVHAATPGDIKSGGVGMRIDYGVHATPFGDCFVALTKRGICALEFLAPVSRAEALANLQSCWPNATLRNKASSSRAVVKRLYSARRATKPLPLYVRGTNFQIKVWEALARIPAGHVCSYEDLARAVEQPSATRAVASAVANNGIALLIPCHRVIRKTGLFGNYRWGETRKRVLLAWEAAHARAPS